MSEFGSLVQDALQDGQHTVQRKLTAGFTLGEKRRVDPFTGFGASFVSGLGELVGLEASPLAKSFREEHPIAGLTSEIAGFAVPYLGWARAAKTVGFAAKVAKIGDITRTPILTGATRSAALFAPFELGRVGVSAALGSDTLGTAQNAAINLGFEFVGGGVGGFLKAAGKAIKRGPQIANEVDLKAPLTLQLRQLKGAVKAETVKNIDAAEFHSNRLAELIKAEKPLGELKTVGPLAGSDSKQVTSFVNRLFRHDAKKGTNWQRSRFLQSSFFASKEDAAEAFIEAGLKGKEDFIQFPNHIQAGSTRGAKEIFRGIAEGFAGKIGPNTWFTQEADNGLYVIAQRIKKGAPGKSFAKGDRWVLFKTDSPGEFATEAKKFADVVNANHAFLWPVQNVAKKIKSEVFDSIVQMQENIPLNNFLDIEPKGLGKLLQQGAELLPTGARATAQKVGDFTRQYITPSAFQFKDSPRAARIFAISQMAFDNAAAKTQAEFFGKTALNSKQDFVRSIFRAGIKEGEDGLTPLNDLLHALNDTTDMVDLTRIRAAQFSAEELKKEFVSGKISDELFAFLEEATRLDARRISEITKVTEKIGGTPVSFQEGHLGLANTWTGTRRAVIVDEAGNNIWMASGRNDGSLIAEADAIIEAGKKEGREFTMGRIFSSNATSDADAILYGVEGKQILVGTPEFSLASAVKERRLAQGNRPLTLREKKGGRGFIGDTRPFTKVEVGNIMLAHARRYDTFLTDASLRHLIADDMFVLQRENPAAYTALTKRLDQFAGKPGAFSKIQNEAVDRILAPVLGKDSASKVIGTVNSAVFELQLGMGNLMFPAMNALTFMSNTLPQVAFAMNAPLEVLQKYYTVFPAIGAGGKVRGSMGKLDMFKLVARSFKEMGNLDKAGLADVQRAITDGVIDPRFVEEWAGATASSIGNIKQAVQEGGVLNLLKNMSSYLPAASEKFSRGHTFVLARMVGRDLMGLAGEDLFRFSREFTNNSMFLYNQSNRAQLINGPIGSFFGMFKNWPMHQIAWLAEYAGLGLNHNQWGPLLWMMGGTAAVGGAGAVPGFALADWIAKKSSDKSLQQLLYANFAEGGDSSLLADSIYYGLPATLGISLQGSVAAPLADPTRDANMMFSIVHWNRAKAIAQAAGGAIDRFAATGEHPANDAKVRDALIRALAPRSINRVMQLTGGEYLRSLNSGYPQAKLTSTQKFMYAAGFNPVTLDKTFQVQSEIWANNDKRRKKIAAFGKIWAQAQQEGDADMLTQVLKDATQQGVPLDSVMKSGNTRLSKARQTSLERNFNQIDVAQFSSVLGK